MYLCSAMEYEELWHRLTPLYDSGEARAIIRMLLDECYGLSWADVLGGKVTELSANDQTELEKNMRRLEKGEPVQYLLGMADFCGRRFHVEPGVLIPRPETEELCRLIVEDERSRSDKAARQSEGHADCHILDIGTGSGCIAITLALELPEAKVTAWDISDDALRIAADNAKALGADICLEKQDILNISPTINSQQPSYRYDFIVSNPPYIQPKERDEMARNVLSYEPSLALFAPEDNPIVFYQHIGDYARQRLNTGGQLWFELNPLTAEKVSQYLQDLGFVDIEIHKDQYDRQRILKATKI